MGEEERREEHRAFIPVANGALRGLWKVNGDMVGFVWWDLCSGMPNWIGHRKRSAEYRFLAIREPLRDPPLPGLGEQLALPFPTVEFCNRGRYKLTVVVTNRELSGEEVIERYRKRCGKSEQVHGLDPAYSL